uniref:Uncharacterized protein n=1 Tax=Lactuca sativa TaxID=4236 RepID=A0A9R1VA63_LACSA|nr:hypothetical protein LSAT_V11C600310520 [Lactuca sativa]
MDPNQNTPHPNFRKHKFDNDFALYTTPHKFPTMESPQGGFRRHGYQLPDTQLKEMHKRLGFLGEISNHIYEITGSESRNPDQIISKWCDIRLKYTKFREIYNNLQNIRKSDSNDFDVFKINLEKKLSARNVFPYVKPCLKLKDAPKWEEQTEGTSQTSSDEQPLRRPVGRNKEKKVGSLASGSSVIVTLESK